AAVLILLCSAGVIEWSRFWILLENGFLFKVLVALLDTPIIYGIIYALKGKIDIAPYQEGLES
ncbi:MAG: queuosine precursor transporter, partial [Fidelibacterota bacterium]